MRAPRILVLSHAEDITADRVEAALRDRGADPVRFDTADYPMRSSIAVACGTGRASATLRRRGAPDVDLTEMASVWYRHPREFQPDPAMTAFERTFVANEAGLAVGGMLRGLDCRWMNHPAAMVEARYKLAQLRLAERCGLAVPPTLVTNQPEAAREFVSASDGAVIKVLGDPVVPNENGPGSSGLIFTSDVEPRHLEQFDRVRQGPCFLQGKIHKRVDLRIVVADSTLLCVEIASQEHPDSRTDYRRRVRWLRHSPCTLPAEVAGAIHRLLRAFRLRFAVVDMAITPAGEHVFFELNANGQWLWLEEATGLPIAGAIADALLAEPDAADAG